MKLTVPSSWFRWSLGRKTAAEIQAAERVRLRRYPLYGIAASMETFSYEQLKASVNQFRFFAGSFLALLQGQYGVVLPEEANDTKLKSSDAATKLLNNIEASYAAAEEKRESLEGLSRCEESHRKKQAMERMLEALCSTNKHPLSDDEYDILSSQTKLLREAVRNTIRGCYSDFPEGPNQDQERRLAQLHDDLSWWLLLVGAINQNDSVFVPEEALCRRILPVTSILIAILKDVKEFVEAQASNGEPVDGLALGPLARNIGGLVSLWTIWCNRLWKQNTSFSEKGLAWHLPKESAVVETRQALRYGRSHLRDEETPEVVESSAKYSLLLEVIG